MHIPYNEVKKYNCKNFNKINSFCPKSSNILAGGAPRPWGMARVSQKSHIWYIGYMIKLTILHNETEDFLEELSGFSILVEAFGLKILYDTSLKDQIISNSEKTGLSLSDIDYVVLSHGHPDHTEGLQNLNYSEVKNLIAHPSCFEKKWDYKDGSFCGCAVPLEELQNKTNVILSKEPYWLIKDKIVFLGETPRENDFESKEPEDKTEQNDEDFVMDDSALVIKSDKGLIIISGCSHAGICNIIEYAEKVADAKTYAVLGGFHLFDNGVIDKTIDYFEKKDIPKIYPSHCLNDYAFAEFKKIGGMRIKTLQELTF